MKKKERLDYEESQKAKRIQENMANRKNERLKHEEHWQSEKAKHRKFLSQPKHPHHQ